MNKAAEKKAVEKKSNNAADTNSQEIEKKTVKTTSTNPLSKLKREKQLEPFVNEQGFFHASRDNTRIFFQRWIPESRARMVLKNTLRLQEFDRRGKSKDELGRVLVVQHGFGEHSDRYMNLIEKLIGTNTSIYALDSRGHGRSEGKRGHVDQFQYYIDDLSDLIQIARREQGVSKVYLMGHSLGGVIASQYTLQYENQKGLEALILSSPAFRVKMNFAQHFKKWAAYTLASISPATTMDANLDIRYLSHDGDVVDAYRNDPLVHGKISFKMGKNLFYLGKALIKKARLLHIPCYVFAGDGDMIVEHRGAKEFFANIVESDKSLKIYPGLYHETMNEIQERRSEVLNDLAKWFLTH